MYKNRSNPVYYILTNVISLDTVDFKEFDAMLWITTLWFSESRAAFKIVVASLEARGVFKILACFLHHNNSKVCLQVHFRFI